MKTIRTYSNLFQAQSAKATLECAGIEVFLKNENTVAVQPLYNVMLGGIELQVDESDVSWALELIGSDDGSYEIVEMICSDNRGILGFILRLGLPF